MSASTDRVVLQEDDVCPKCAEGFLEWHSHRFSTERGPNIPDADWLQCDVCMYQTDPE